MLNRSTLIIIFPPLRPVAACVARTRSRAERALELRAAVDFAQRLMFRSIANNPGQNNQRAFGKVAKALKP
eukprot:826993-Pyramimonas_sp.AAC.2